MALVGETTEDQILAAVLTEWVTFDKGAFDGKSLVQIVGEAAYSLSQQLKADNPQIPWDQIIGMRHVLVHGYFEIDLDIVWAVIEKDLPPLHDAIEATLRRPES